MNWLRVLQIIQIVSAALLIATILLQSRGTGLSGVFGGASGIYRTKRGIEKTLFIASIVLAVLFFGTALATIFFKK
ncbi:preprotein translocase subunit SecG [Candidatus Falkowbacteria bacterium]|nr:preprotein translocase subunit SecG [Candidatus Falkowbacteria bacterium]